MSIALTIPIVKLFIKRYLYSIDILQERVLLISKINIASKGLKEEV